MKFKKFFLQRVLAWALTILIGVTFIFFIPRMFPSDPVENRSEERRVGKVV